MSQRLSCLISQVKMVLLVQHDWLTLFSGAGAMVSITQRPGAISFLISTFSVAATGLIVWADRPYMRAYSALGAVIFGCRNLSARPREAFVNGLARRFLRFCPLIALLGVGTAAAAQSPLFGETTVGNTSVVVRTVTGTMEDGKRVLSFEDDVYHNELISTEEESATQITFLDESTISLGADSSIVLDQFVYDPDPSNSSFVITITQGALRFTSGVLPNEAYEIHTPVATIGIRGTIIDVVVDRETRSDGTIYISVNLSVVDGEADLIDCEGEVTLVPTNFSSTIAGSSEGCSEASEPGSLPLDYTELHRTRDELLSQ